MLVAPRTMMTDHEPLFCGFEGAVQHRPVDRSGVVDEHLR